MSGTDPDSPSGLKFGGHEAFGTVTISYLHPLTGAEFGETRIACRVSIWTKISSVPSPRVIKPNPETRLNHLTIPRTQSLSGSTVKHGF